MFSYTTIFPDVGDHLVAQKQAGIATRPSLQIDQRQTGILSSILFPGDGRPAHKTAAGNQEGTLQLLVDRYPIDCNVCCLRLAVAWTQLNNITNLAAKVQEAAFGMWFSGAVGPIGVINEQRLKLMTGYPTQTNGVGEGHQTKPIAKSQFITGRQTAANVGCVQDGQINIMSIDPAAGKDGIGDKIGQRRLVAGKGIAHGIRREMRVLSNLP